ncbi:MAG TPA: LON peptidase substrate-binding domain-containing protein, partial [Solirubrobacteraceae bacterium]|nr:LON peptidase substrate-binding domain-containing protein [Solirubrobacteraceae bacterium]
MSAQREQGFPLFPLNIVALPSETVPLHIFEERYKRMIEDCLERECELGIVWLAEE